MCAYFACFHSGDYSSLRMCVSSQPMCYEWHMTYRMFFCEIFLWSPRNLINNAKWPWIHSVRTCFCLQNAELAAGMYHRAQPIYTFDNFFFHFGFKFSGFIFFLYFTLLRRTWLKGSIHVYLRCAVMTCLNSIAPPWRPPLVLSITMALLLTPAFVFSITEAISVLSLHFYHEAKLNSGS